MYVLRHTDGREASMRRFRLRRSAEIHARKVAHAEADRSLQAVTIEVWWENDAGVAKVREAEYTAPAPSY